MSQSVLEILKIFKTYQPEDKKESQILKTGFFGFKKKKKLIQTLKKTMIMESSGWG